MVGAAASAEGGSRREILVIDDHPQARDMIAILLGRLGWTTRQAASGEEAMSEMAAHAATVGLALVDVMLPDTDGMSLARELSRSYPKLAIVIMSGELNDESRWIVSEEGFRFLPKPFSLSQLRDVIAEMLGDGAPGGPG